MDAHELFIRYKEGYLPTVKDIHKLFISGDVQRLELAALMYASKQKKIDMDAVFAYNPKKCKALAETMLTATVVQNSTFDESVESSDVQLSLAAFANLSLSDNKTKKHKKHKAEAINENRNFVAECNDFFLYKSRSRIKSLATLLNAISQMRWVRFVASKIETNETFESKEFRLLSDTSLRHVHVSSSEMCDFLRALTRNEVKTFSWSLDQDTVINLSTLRKALSDISSEPILLIVIMCSIGLPTFKLYNPLEFLQHWKSFRFDRVSNGNVVKTICRPLFESEATKSELNELLDQYESKHFAIDESPKTVETFMFKHWYSYPPRSILEQLADSANAILKRCNSI